MKKRNPQCWLVTYKLGKKRETVTTPMLTFPWQALLWINQMKPTAEVLKIEPFRALSAKK